MTATAFRTEIFNLNVMQNIAVTASTARHSRAPKGDVGEMGAVGALPAASEELCSPPAAMSGTRRPLSLLLLCGSTS